MTQRQLQILGMAKTWACKHVEAFDDPQYRLVQRNVGHVEEDATGRISGKGLSNSGFEQVMAWFEEIGWAQPGGRSDYWRTKAKRVNDGEITDRQIQMIEALASDYRQDHPDFSLDGFVHRMSHHRTTMVENLWAREGYNVIEALKKMVARDEGDTGGPLPVEAVCVPAGAADADAGAMNEEIPF